MVSTVITRVNPPIQSRGLTCSEAQEFQPLSPAPLTSSRSADMTRRREASPDLDITKLGTFGRDMDEIISVAMADPNRLSARSQMELVRQIFTKVVENPKISELAAKFCIGIIEREKKETFLESLLNTSQEWYHERDRILQAGPKWAAFMSFLNDLYGLVSCHLSLTSNISNVFSLLLKMMELVTPLKEG